ncbi:hypothetical protein PPYR_01141 [Photinus pyralis]|uniref:Myrosinase 1-like n=2 Tax=Photinus pyralis TaxID=7054 RepID=A0A5N4B3H5_PHOPY|nr:myrosinase 1-like isoform X2 [Photinus pyralis]XP_031344242.1 myrosinase 1-like isoform X2 [Photinus pyralis]XP_031344251.1 myrosinase 1-like isoform X2 [Photinus pyralis]KAB0804171.1 hypothetical protein PPYR_01141 [Photinus pyralis]
MLTVILLLTVLLINSQSINVKKFPNDFVFGVASSSQQVEGAWDVDGKGETMWDHLVRNYPEKVEGKNYIDMSCDSYYKTVEDVRHLKDLGVQFYRFSINWARIMPTGFPNRINQAGIDYYSNLIDELLANDISPIVTIYHWELPQTLSTMGGFVNNDVVSWLEDYARVLFEYFGTRVKHWISVNEPRIMCQFGYGNGNFAPGVKLSGIADYLCDHNALKAHAKIYRLYQNDFKPTQQGQVGISIDLQWYEPATDSLDDLNATKRVIQFEIDKYLHPIFTKKGDYPELLKRLVREESESEGYFRSRLPEFTTEEVEQLKRSSDFLAINHYTTYLVQNKETNFSANPSVEKDFKADLVFDPSWESSAFTLFKVVPWGVRKLLKYIKDNYDDINIYITENGYADTHSIHDEKRVNYHKRLLSNVLDSIYEDNVPVKAYMAWSFLDSFEWSAGYNFGFGLYYVNFSDPNRPRIPKDSAKYYSKVIKDRGLVSKTEL